MERRWILSLPQISGFDHDWLTPFTVLRPSAGTGGDNHLLPPHPVPGRSEHLLFCRYCLFSCLLFILTRWEPWESTALVGLTQALVSSVYSGAWSRAGAQSKCLNKWVSNNLVLL